MYMYVFVRQRVYAYPTIAADFYALTEKKKEKAFFFCAKACYPSINLAYIRFDELDY